jgi:hypothetical protein
MSSRSSPLKYDAAYSWSASQIIASSLLATIMCAYS